MEQPSLSEQLLSVIQKKTLRAAISKKYQELDTDALTLSIDMNYNRSNVSRTLNNLNRAGFLIKVHGRPTLYLDKKTLCDFYNLSQIPMALDNLEQMRRLFLTDGLSETSIPVVAFDAFVGTGVHEGLHTPIQEATKMALYPARPHAYLIYGLAGSGKKCFTQAVFRMENELQALKEPRDPVWLDLTSPDFPAQLADCTAGAGPKGACIGFLNAERAPEHALHTLQRWYALQDAAAVPQICACAVICESAQLPQTLPSLLYPAPVVISIPTLAQRSVKERILFILNAFQAQADLLRLPVQLDRPCFQAMVLAQYRSNLQSLNNVVRETCRNCYYRSYPCANGLNISLDDMPNAVHEDTLDVQQVLPFLQILERKVHLSAFEFLPGKTVPAYGQIRGIPLDKDLRPVMPNTPAVQSRAPCTSLYLQCEQDLRHAGEAYQNSQNSKSIQILSKTITGILEPGGTVANQGVYFGLYRHLDMALRALLSGTYTEPSPPIDGLEDADLSDQAKRVIDAVQAQFCLTLPTVERQYIHIYLSHVRDGCGSARVKLAVLCHWSEIITVYQRFTSSLLYENQPSFYCYKSDAAGREWQLQARHIIGGLLAANEGAGMVIISDGPLDSELTKLIYKELGSNVFFVNQLSQEIIRKALMFFDDPMATLEEFGRLILSSSGIRQGCESRISMRIRALIGDTLTFLDANKVYHALSDALVTILDTLHMPQNDSLSIRFTVHAAFTIERAIRGESLPYKKAAEYLRAHHELALKIRQGLIAIQNLYNIQIPDNELAYIVEIFDDYV